MKRERREPLEVVVVERARCPRCDSANLRRRGGGDQGDGSVLRYVACRDCGKYFVVVLE